MSNNEKRISNERLAATIQRLIGKGNAMVGYMDTPEAIEAGAATSLASWQRETEAAMGLALQALRSTPVEAEPVAWLKVWTANIGAFSAPGRRVDFSPNLEPWLEPLTPTVTPLYARPLPNPSPSDGEVSEAEVNNALSAMWKAQGLGWTPHAAMRSALKTSKRGQP